MGVQWTDEQRKVIELRNRNILVSAAAGSGKTAVLVERIIQMLTDKTHPVEVDRLLIVTFTEAAASEMKERIRNAIEKALEIYPDDVHLQRQATLIHSAKIMTIHSFCLSVIREHFHVIDIDPGFRIVEESELKLLKQDVLEEVLEEYYDSQDKEFLELTEKLGGTKSDKKLEEQILKLYEYSRSYPQPEKWLAQCVNNYECGGLEGNVFFEKAEDYVRKYIEDIRILLLNSLQMCEETDGPYMYAEAFETAIDMMEHVGASKDFLEMYERISQVSFKRLSAKKDASVDPTKRETVKKLMEQVRELVKSVVKVCFYAPPQELVNEIHASAGTIRAFTEVVQKFASAFAEKKQSKNMIDFNDMEQFALRILTEDMDGNLVPSATAREYQEMFEEVMIDEYQDSNLIQEAILTSVSRVSQNKNNIFMVGDVKQSIYRFRLSRPELFMEKYNSYNIEESECQRVDLHKNFRSRFEVLDSTNYIFRRIMRKELGGVEYDDQAALYPGASYENLKDEAGDNLNEAELILVDPGNSQERTQWSFEDGHKELTGRQMEGKAIAKRIKELLINYKVTDKKTGELRPVRYKDIVILTRSVQGWSDTLAAELMEEGIPAYADSRTGYFEAYEVKILLDYLRLLDNQRQDIPLTAVLTSPFVGLNAQELAQIRLIDQESAFYEAAEKYARGEIAEDSGNVLNENVQKKLISFYSTLTGYRKKMLYLTLHELLWKILDETGYGLFITAMPGGEQRRANIEMLVDKAVAFEKTSYKGLFHFIRYIEQLEKHNVDYGEAGYINEDSDAVQLMSIHKSKGLEFPVVFVAGLGKKFNMTDSAADVVMHPELGVGIDSIDLEKRTKTPTLIKKIIQKEIVTESLGEELRVLYVAMTRAKEKLILIGQKSMESLEKSLVYSNEIPFYVLSGAKNYLDWILAAILEKPAPIQIILKNFYDVKVETRIETGADFIAENVLADWDVNQIYNEELKEQINRQFSYVYPYETDRKMKMKFTVSELKKRKYLQEESGELLFEEAETVPLIPEFLREAEEVSGTSRGSAYHKVLELLDFKKTYDREALNAEIQDLCGKQKLSEEMAVTVRINDILNFLESSVGKRMQVAARAGVLFKEQPFVLGINAEEIYQEEGKGETILIQGIIDVFFEEDGELVLLDYKTDKVHSARLLLDRYQSQLDYYAKALEQLLEKKVKEKIIYSFALNKEIKCK